MVNENLLATYSLLSYLMENDKEDKRREIRHLFIPLICESLNSLIIKNKGNTVMGKDYSEIYDAIKNQFGIEIPIPVLENLLPLVNQHASGMITIHGDHSFIIKPAQYKSLHKQHNKKKGAIQILEADYKRFCYSLNVEYDFDELIEFIQDQNNRIFEKKESKLESQKYYVSKYVNGKLKAKDKCWDTICELYLGGLISSYFQFKVNEQIVDTELLIDTNFYISLINLNTEEAYITCKQLYDITIKMGFRYSILESTKEQIRILINTQLENYSKRDVYATINPANILSACVRRDLERSDLANIKDDLDYNLSRLGISTVYNANIKNLIDRAEKSKELNALSIIRGNRESAFHDLLAGEYVKEKRKKKAITEFTDVNCWFLNNSFSVNRKEVNLPLKDRCDISASDLLTLLWLSNPSLEIKNPKSILAVSSLSASIIRYRNKNIPSVKLIDKIYNRIAKLQSQQLISQKNIANLCIRLSEGCIDEKEANRLIVLTTNDFLQYVNSIEDEAQKHLQISEENERLRKENEQLRKQTLEEKTKHYIDRSRRYFSLFFIAEIVIWLVGAYSLPFIIHTWYGWLASLFYFLLTTILSIWINPQTIKDAFSSFVNYKRVYNRVYKRISDLE
jgi:hypothetical protein